MKNPRDTDLMVREFSVEVRPEIRVERHFKIQKSHFYAEKSGSKKGL